MTNYSDALPLVSRQARRRLRLILNVERLLFTSECGELKVGLVGLEWKLNKVCSRANLRKALTTYRRLGLNGYWTARERHRLDVLRCLRAETAKARPGHRA